MVYMMFLILLSICLTSFLILKKITVKTSTMAIVMAMGITTQGPLTNYFGSAFFLMGYGKFISVIVFSLWISFLLSFLVSLFKKTFKENHYLDPINRFGIGTWVAGTSICGILLDKHFHDFIIVSKVLTFSNLCLWIIYIAISIKTLIHFQNEQLIKRAHGILLLTTVSTQSLVLLLNTDFSPIPKVINLSLIVFGVMFYCFNVFFIIKRYWNKSFTRDLATQWNNTNCILHGALSITGLACVTSKTMNDQVITIIWLCATAMFVMVECIEICRIFKRIKLFGLRKGIFIYDVSQWSRLFTFAMFYTFTSSFLSPPFFILKIIQNLIIMSGIWGVLALVLIEIFILLSNNVSKGIQPDNPFSVRKVDRYL